MARPRIFQVESILEGISPLKDGGMSLRFHTNEIKEARNKTKLMTFYNTFGWLQFSDQSINAIPDKPATRETGAKTPSQRLYAVLFVLWRSKYSDMPFDAWYEQQIEKIINRVKEELPPR